MTCKVQNYEHENTMNIYYKRMNIYSRDIISILIS